MADWRKSYEHNELGSHSQARRNQNQRQLPRGSRFVPRGAHSQGNWDQPIFKDDIVVKGKYSLGCDDDKEAIFDFPFILDDETLSYLRGHGLIMFLIRGPPGTGKATLRDMIIERYPGAPVCCADHYFTNSFVSPERNKDTMKASHSYCQKKAEAACAKMESPIIIQNTHMRKWEMQIYLDMAAMHNYTVIMAITLYKFDVTPQALANNNTDGLDINYFRNRLRQWENVIPVLTGWFISPYDSSYLLSSLLTALEGLLDDGKFCRIFDVYNCGDILSYFQARRLLFCVAGYTKNETKMKMYYLSERVRECYGQSYVITIIGYLVTLSDVMALVEINESFQDLIPSEEGDEAEQIGISDTFKSLVISNNMFQHGKVIPFSREESTSKNTAVLEDWKDEEAINTTNCSFIHLAQKSDDVFDVSVLKKSFHDALSSVAEAEGYINDTQFSLLSNGTKVCRLIGEKWLIQVPKKISIKTVFTGLYI